MLSNNNKILMKTNNFQHVYLAAGGGDEAAVLMGNEIYRYINISVFCTLHLFLLFLLFILTIIV